ncbi:hypothetical protein M501DRAFT_1000048 [Patellaria atrata CBS 101060]|uniref:Uncharacterized protein n=1 Tax=Patellaria atrata CBS 101060 TaxID=1346257 RepID=A0A9P4VNL1_9PEZI|nr:hypothetical protein M501DRAFT_1000048 [Patellaria atrata CBS 101060]
MADMQVVLYNPAIALAAQANRNPVLLIAQQQLAPWYHSPQSRALLAVGGGVDVEFVRGSITPQQIESHRQSYVNRILIQSRGGDIDPCTACRTRGFRPFLSCRRAGVHFGGACANCKWCDHAARRSVRAGGLYKPSYGDRLLGSDPRDDRADGSAPGNAITLGDDDEGATPQNVIIIV